MTKDATKEPDSEESILKKSIKIINKVNTIGAYKPWKLFFRLLMQNARIAEGKETKKIKPK